MLAIIGRVQKNITEREERIEKSENSEQEKWIQNQLYRLSVKTKTRNAAKNPIENIYNTLNAIYIVVLELIPPDSDLYVLP